MTNTITFKEIVKMVHPDINKNITDAGAKMAQVMANRSNTSYLYTLAVKWGLFGGATKEEIKEKVKLLSILLGTVLYRKGDKLVVVGLDKFTRGRNKGLHKVIYFNKRKGGLYYTAASSLNNLNAGSISGFQISDITEVGTASYNQGVSKLGGIKSHNDNIKQTRKARKAAQEDANSGIGVGDTVYVRTKGSFVTVTRRTAKRVYFMFAGKESYANLSSVQAM